MLGRQTSAWRSVKTEMCDLLVTSGPKRLLYTSASSHCFLCIEYAFFNLQSLVCHLCCYDFTSCCASHWWQKHPQLESWLWQFRPAEKPHEQEWIRMIRWSAVLLVCTSSKCANQTIYPHCRRFTFHTLDEFVSRDSSPLYDDRVPISHSRMQLTPWQCKLILIHCSIRTLKKCSRPTMSSKLMQQHKVSLCVTVNDYWNSGLLERLHKEFQQALSF